MRRRDRVGRLPVAALAVGGALPFVLSCLAPAARADGAKYRYFARKNLARVLATDPDKWVDSDVTVTDVLAYVFTPNPAQDTEVKEKTVYQRFDTFYFRCAIDTSKKGDYLDAIWDSAKKGAKDIMDQIEKINEDERTRKISSTDADKQRHDLYWQLTERWKAQPIVTVFGKVSRADFFTPGYYSDKGPEPDAKAAPETITILCDRVEKPRERFYENLDDN